MPPAARFLQTNGHLPVAEPPDPLAVDSDVVVILMALLGPLIFAVGLVLLARCARLRRSSGLGGGREPSPPLSDKGLKNKTIRSIPKISFAGTGGRVANCPICLAEFVEGDEIRILPPCGHGFHVKCVDTWLRSHSSCPSCRQILVVATAAPSWCRHCGASSSTAASSTAEEGGAKANKDGDASKDGDANNFLP